MCNTYILIKFITHYVGITTRKAKHTKYICKLLVCILELLSGSLFSPSSPSPELNQDFHTDILVLNVPRVSRLCNSSKEYTLSTMPLK